MTTEGSSETSRAERPHQQPPRVEWGTLRSIAPRDYLIRFAFGFVISVVSAVVTLLAGPRIGGLFLAFPAILPATLTLVERKEGLAQAASDVRGATLGAVGMIAFACAIAALVERSAPLALVAALVAWVVVSGLAYLAVRGLMHALGERQYLPEIPTSEAAELVGLLIDRRLTVATAESCSGGMVSALLCSVPDASKVVRGALVAYTDEAKRSLLGVAAQTLARHGAISAEVATEMAQGAHRATGADVAIAVTGATGTSAEGKPPGVTFIAVLVPGDRVTVRRFSDDLGPGRNDERAVRMALQVGASAVKEGHAIRLSLA